MTHTLLGYHRHHFVLLRRDVTSLLRCSFFPPTATFWNWLEKGCFPDHYDLNVSSLGLTVIYHTYPCSLRLLNCNPLPRVRLRPSNSWTVMKKKGEKIRSVSCAPIITERTNHLHIRRATSPSRGITFYFRYNLVFLRQIKN